MRIKIVILLLLCLSINWISGAQIKLNPYYPYSKWSIGGGVGFSEIYGNLDHSNSEPVFRLNVERNANMWVSYGLEVQKGSLSDYEVKNHWTNGLSVYNQFTAYDLNAKIQIGELFRYPKSFLAKTLFGLYFGVGVGYMKNNVSNITLRFKHADKYTITDFDNINVKRNTENYFIPFNFGFNLHMTKRATFNINYQFSYAFSDYLDGYNFQAPIATNKYNDMFSVLSFGVNWYVGKVTYHYRKFGEKKKK